MLFGERDLFELGFVDRADAGALLDAPEIVLARQGQDETVDVGVATSQAGAEVGKVLGERQK